MNKARSGTMSDAAGERLAPGDAPPPDPSSWDALSDGDRASIERGLAQSLAGLYATDEEVEAAWAAFGP